MTRTRILFSLLMTGILAYALTGCTVLKESAKYEFADGIYRTQRIGGSKVYLLNIDDGDTLSVFPVKYYKKEDSDAVVTNGRVNYTPTQRKFKDNKPVHTFYRPSFDVDIMTIPTKYRPAEAWVPNQLTTNFNGAVYGGYRVDAYSVKYKRTPLGSYKQKVKHLGYSAGLYAGLGNTFVDATSLRDSTTLQYEGVLLITGVAANMAVENLNFGLAFGVDHLLDKNAPHWIYQGRPCIGITLGLNIN